MDKKATSVRQLTCDEAQRLSEDVRAGTTLLPEDGYALSAHMDTCNSETAHK